ncbi:hypothetical protein WA026_006576 [Henosepilachna vigintioctopunctata]|uniref:Uncharacterized protein n=1 Tax=Henosepilachna vigintioctopunctata TaxID=420089 RepID=A0AAW1U762_9CUCU
METHFPTNSRSYTSSVISYASPFSLVGGIRSAFTPYDEIALDLHGTGVSYGNLPKMRPNTNRASDFESDYPLCIIPLFREDTSVLLCGREFTDPIYSQTK